MSEDALYKNLMLLGVGIEGCLHRKETLPALVLVYSAIDTAGWLDSDQASATRQSFTSWVKQYLLKEDGLNCNPIDLYAARCGLLHTSTPDSDLSAQGRARRILYAWGTARVEDLQKTIDHLDAGSKYVAVHVTHLYDAWRSGIGEFVEQVSADGARRSQVYAKSRKFFTGLDVQIVEDLVSHLEKSNA